MKTLVINIDAARVWRETAALTEYAGAAAGATVAADGTTDGDGWDASRMTDGVRDDLARFFCEACAVLSERLAEFVHSIAEGCGAEITLYVADGWKDALAADVQRAAESYFVNALAARWFRFTSGDMSNVYAGDAQGDLDTLGSLLYVRKRPQREERKEGSDE